MGELPKEWQPTKVSDVGTLIKGISYKKHEARKIQGNGLKPILRANNINGNLNFEDLVYVPENRIVAQQYIKKHDVLFCMSSGSKNLVGKTSQAEKNFDGSYGVFCSLFRPSSIINQRFVGYFFQAPHYRKFIRAISKGTNINNLKREHILNIDFCLPSLQEQNQMVNSLEELFSDLDNAIENLKKTQDQLKIYRQSVLKYAFEGRLNRTKSSSDEWIRKTIGETCITGSGGTPSRSNAKYFTGNIPWVKSGELDFNIIYDTEEKITQEALNNSSAKLVKNGTLLIALYGATVGKMAFLGVDAATNQAVCFIETPKCLNSKFLYYFLVLNRDRLLSQRIGGAQPNISQTIIKNMLCPIPSVEEQDVIIKIIESRFSVCDKMEETIENSLKQAEALRQSILKQAFEGKLTEQWRKEHKDLISGENSAEALLKKIKAEKGTLKGKQ